MGDPPEITDNISADSTNPPETLDNRTEESDPTYPPETLDIQNIEAGCTRETDSVLPPPTLDHRIEVSEHARGPSQNLTADSTNSPEISASPMTIMQMVDSPANFVESGAEPLNRAPVTRSDEQPTRRIAMDELCRLCLMRCAEEMQRIFDDVMFPDNILALAQLQIHVGDGLPEQVCHHCVYQMKSALAFVAQCRESDHTLRDYLYKLHQARTLVDHVPNHRGREGSELKEATALVTEADRKEQSDREGSGDAVRVVADCSEKPQVAVQFASSILSGLLQRPTNVTVRRERERLARDAESVRRKVERGSGEAGVVAVRRDENVRRERRDVVNISVTSETRQPMDITNVVNNRHQKDVSVKNPIRTIAIEQYAPSKKHDHRQTNCDIAQDLMTNIVSGLTGRDVRMYSGEENHSEMREDPLHRLNHAAEIKSVNGFTSNKGKLLKTIKTLGITKESVFNDVELQLDAMMNSPKVAENKDATVKLLNVRNKGDQNRQSFYIDQALDNLKDQLHIPNGIKGKYEMVEELRNGLSKPHCKRMKYTNGDVSPKRSLCEELLSSFRGQVIESMTVYVASTDTNEVKRNETQKANEENTNNLGAVVVEVLPGNKDAFHTSVSVEGGECLAETMTNGVKTDPEASVDQEETIIIRISDSESQEVQDHTNLIKEESSNIEENYENQAEEEFHVIVEENNDAEVNFKEEAMEVEQCVEEPYSTDEVITGDVVFTVPTNGELLQCKLEEGTEDKVYVGNEINGEILFFDVQEEVVIETADFDLNNLPIEDSTEILDYPSTSGEAVVVKTEPQGEYAFGCETCTKSFKRKKALLSHMRLHTFLNFGLEHEQKKDPTNKLYKCDVCFKCYISKAGLKIHRNRLHEEGKFACPECDLLFASKVLLVAHIKTHKQKVYKCNRCMKTFQKRKTFVAHTRIHAQNVYKCATCLETYGDEEDLKEHFKMHKAHDVATGQSVQSASRNEAQVEQFQRMKFEYCLSYVGLVKSMFETQPDLYNGFLDTIKDFKFQRINVQGLLVQISQLFKDHRELIAGFNTFMPHGFKIELPHEDKVSGGVPEVVPVPDQQGPDMDLDYSLSYLSQIKSMFSNQPKIYHDFTYIIKEYKLKTMEIPEVIRRVSHLFRDYPELIAGFNSFLPPWCKIKVAQTAKKEKEDIDPMEPSVRPGPSGTSSAPGHHVSALSNGKPADLASPAANLANLGRYKRKTVLPPNTVDHFKKVKMELLASDKVFKTINQTNKVPETREASPAASRVETATVQRAAESDADVVAIGSVVVQPTQNIVETITSLCDQLQTIVDKQAYPIGEGVDQSQDGGEVETLAEESSEGAVAPGVYSHVCHVCLKSFQKRNVLQAHMKEHKR